MRNFANKWMIAIMLAFTIGALTEIGYALRKEKFNQKMYIALSIVSGIYAFTRKDDDEE